MPGDLLPFLMIRIKKIAVCKTHLCPSI